jgi:hypothetical protein
MSVTFFCPDDPEVVDFNACQCRVTSEPTDEIHMHWSEMREPFCHDRRNLYLKEADPECFTCNGEGGYRYPNRKLELNVANGNARTIGRLLGLEMGGEYGELYGEAEAETCSTLLQRILVLKNSPSRRSQATYEPTCEEWTTPVAQDDGTTRLVKSGWYQGGVSDSQVLHYLESMEKLLKFVVDHQSTLHWS